MTDELDRHIRRLNAERQRPMARWNTPKPDPDTDPATIENRRRIARSIAHTKATP